MKFRLLSVIGALYQLLELVLVARTKPKPKIDKRPNKAISSFVNDFMMLLVNNKKTSLIKL